MIGDGGAAGGPQPGHPPAAPPAGALSVDEVVAALAAHSYVCDRRLATAIVIALRLQRPLFVEGEAGVGKTELARALAAVLGARLIRLQCYEGIDLAHAAYEWDYSRQLLHIRLMEREVGIDREVLEQDLFGERFLLRRPLLDAIDNTDATPPLLLIDEIDRSDEEFEAFLLELLSDFAVSVPELGTVRARQPPVVILTGNRTREVHDALKRRCIYHWIDYPDLEREVAIVLARAPEASRALARQVTAAVQALRGMELYKLPGVAETVDWARSLAALGVERLDAPAVVATAGAAVKYQEDLLRVHDAAAGLAEHAAAGDARGDG